MPRRPADPELRKEFADKLRLAVVGHVSKKSAATVLGVSRQMLDLYLDERAAPGPDVLLRAMREWKFTLKYRGREVSSSQFERPHASEMATIPEQLPLFDAIRDLDKRDVQISILKKEADRIDLQVSIKFAG